MYVIMISARTECGVHGIIALRVLTELGEMSVQSTERSSPGAIHKDRAPPLERRSGGKAKRRYRTLEEPHCIYQVMFVYELYLYGTCLGSR